MPVDVLVNIDVHELDKALTFYCRAFELSIGRRFGDSGVELLGASSNIYLLVKAPGSAASKLSPDRRDYRRHWTPVHLDFVVPDIRSAVERIRAAGGAVEGDVQTHKWGHIALMSDPFGHGFCVIEFRGRGYDEIASQ
jgi:predicted enzyme related to lactoylglutathione lyase